MKTLIILLCFSLTFLKAQDRILNPRGSYSKLLDSIVFEEKNPNVGYRKTKNSYEYNSDFSLKSETDFYWDTISNKYNFYKCNYNYISKNPLIYEQSYDSLGMNLYVTRYKQIDSNSALKRSKYFYKFENGLWKLYSRIDSFINPNFNLIDSILNFHIDSTNNLKLTKRNDFEYYPDTRLKYRYTSNIYLLGYSHENRYYDNFGRWSTLISTRFKNKDTNFIETLIYDNNDNLDSVQFSSWSYINGIRTYIIGGYTKFKYDRTVEFKNVLFNYSNIYYGNPYVHMLLEEIEANTSGLFYSKRKFYYSDNKFSSIILTKNSVVNIYPNPATNNLTIETEIPIYLKMTDLLGREILTREFHKTSNLEVSNIPNGLYIYQIFNQKNEPIQSNKLEIKH